MRYQYVQATAMSGRWYAATAQDVADEGATRASLKWDPALLRFAARRGRTGDAGRWLYIRHGVAPLF